MNKAKQKMNKTIRHPFKIWFPFAVPRSFQSGTPFLA
jgi:hypothetical protein